MNGDAELTALGGLSRTVAAEHDRQRRNWSVSPVIIDKSTEASGSTAKVHSSLLNDLLLAHEQISGRTPESRQSFYYDITHGVTDLSQEQLGDTHMEDDVILQEYPIRQYEGEGPLNPSWYLPESAEQRNWLDFVADLGVS